MDPIETRQADKLPTEVDSSVFEENLARIREFSELPNLEERLSRTEYVAGITWYVYQLSDLTATNRDIILREILTASTNLLSRIQSGEHVDLSVEKLPRYRLGVEPSAVVEFGDGTFREMTVPRPQQSLTEWCEKVARYVVAGARKIQMLHEGDISKLISELISLTEESLRKEGS